ncbi:MAG: hypothetical protein ACPIB2_06245 [Flavobacteriaceae bacterium]
MATIPIELAKTRIDTIVPFEEKREAKENTRQRLFQQGYKTRHSKDHKLFSLRIVARG